MKTHVPDEFLTVTTRILGLDPTDVDSLTGAYTNIYKQISEHLLMAGKCLSAAHEAVASTRVIPICMAQGQAVGTAAALAVRRGVSPRDVPIRDLQATLIAQGAELRQSLGEPNWAAIEEVGQLPKQRLAPATPGTPGTPGTPATPATPATVAPKIPAVVPVAAPTVPAERWVR